jgi:hypothetical protein
MGASWPVMLRPMSVLEPIAPSLPDADSAAVALAEACEAARLAGEHLSDGEVGAAISAIGRAVSELHGAEGALVFG